MDAYPDTIGSSDVKNSNITYPMNQSQIVTRITDHHGNPVAFQPINLTLAPDDAAVVQSDPDRAASRTPAASSAPSSSWLTAS